MLGRSVAISGWVTVAAGLALMAVHYFAGTDGDPEGWFSAVGFGAPFVGAGGLALVGGRSAKPMLCVAGGIALVIMSMVSIIMFPLLIPAGFMIGSTRNATVHGSIAVPAVFAAGLVAVFGLLLFHQDPVTWSTPNGGGGSSNIVTSVEASISLGVVAVVVLGAIVWSARSVMSR